MGLFGPKIEVDLREPGEVRVDAAVRDALPDPVEYFLDWLPVMPDDGGRLLAEIEHRRHRNGSLVSTNFSDVPGIGRKQNLLTFLDAMTTYRPAVCVAAWATSDLSGRDSKKLWNILEELGNQQGEAAAVTWAYQARAAERPSVSLASLGQSIEECWDDGLNWVTNNDVIKAMKNWNS